MSRYRGPITRISRRLGVILFTNTGNSKSKAFNKKNYKPGMHGQKRFAQLSEFNKHLREKQKVKYIFGITEKQMVKYNSLASKSDEVTGIKFLKLLEQRLDNTIFRTGFASTRPQARQIASHGIIKLNNKKVKTASIQVKVGDIIEVREKSKNSKLFEGVKNTKYNPPKWLKVDMKNLKAEVIAVPDEDDIEKLIEHQLITEYYSR